MRILVLFWILTDVVLQPIVRPSLVDHSSLVQDHSGSSIQRHPRRGIIESFKTLVWVSLLLLVVLYICAIFCTQMIGDSSPETSACHCRLAWSWCGGEDYAKFGQPNFVKKSAKFGPFSWLSRHCFSTFFAINSNIHFAAFTKMIQLNFQFLQMMSNISEYFEFCTKCWIFTNVEIMFS